MRSESKAADDSNSLAWPTSEAAPAIEVRDLEMRYGSYVVMRDINFAVGEGQVFVIMGGSGCGKSTLLKYLIGLKEVTQGDVLYHGQSFAKATQEEREQLQRTFGVLYQSGALWSSRTLAENVALPLEEYTELSAKEIRELASLKLSLVGLKGFEDFYPSEISGGMRKRAGLARAMALDPATLFFDEPSAGLDPISSRRLDDLILQLRDSLGTTVVAVTHELASIFAIADTAIFLDAETKRMIVQGDPKVLVKEGPPMVKTFLLRGQEVSPLDQEQDPVQTGESTAQ
jgi:phospholipid/cholesterol/gamma-HCH transport system ATP-binding protein